MMSLKDNNEKKDDEITTSGALNTEEILSLLSKTSQDFKIQSASVAISTNNQS